MSVAVPERARPRPRLWHNLRVLRLGFQVLVVAITLLLLRYLFANLTANLEASGIPRDFGFLDRPAGYDIRGTDFRPSQPIRDALWIGYLNTIRVASVGIVLATVWGVLVGIGRLSTNWLVRKSTAVYVETLRNTPVLLTIAFIYFAILLTALPGIADAPNLLGVLLLSTRGIWIASGQATGPLGGLALIVVAAIVAAAALAAWRTYRFNKTGVPHHRSLWGWGALVAIVAIGYAWMGAPISPSLPVREGRLVTGGLWLEPAFGALLAGLVLYTSSHIAEIVRGSILAVHSGQNEAAKSLGLTSAQRLRHVVLPQAFRIAVPSLASQYLNLTKNSSLAIFIGYVEYTRVTFTNIGNANPAPQSIVILGVGYLALSLLIAAVTNVVNRSLALKTS